MRASIIAFIVMVVAFVVVDWVVVKALSDSHRNARLVSQIGTQRARAEAMAKNALLYSSADSPLVAGRAKDEFLWNLQSMSQTQRLLLRADVLSELISLESSDRALAWAPMQGAFEEFERSANRFEAAITGEHASPAAKLAAGDLADQARAYDQCTSDFVVALTEQNVVSIDNSRRTALFMLAMFVLTLLGQAIYIFRPILRRVRHSLEQVQLLQNQVEGQNEQLSERNRRLEEQRRALEQQRLEVEEQNDRLKESRTRLEEQSAVLAQQHRDTRAQKEQLEQLAMSLEAAKELQAQAARRAEELFRGVPVACFSFDGDGVLHAWNSAAEELYGYAAFEVLWQPMWSALGHPEAEESSREAIRQVFEENGSAVSEWTFTRRDGEKRIVQTTSFPIRDSAGRVVAGIGTTLDFTERRQYEHAIEESIQRINEQKVELQEANRMLSALASTDGLTGLTNHRAFQERLESEFEVSVREGTPLSVVLADVDNFKKLNDQYGHPAGDRVLQAVASVLRDVCGQDGVACRYGGEEFVSILPGFDEQAAAVVAERMRAAIEAEGPDNLVVTASFGVTSWRSSTRSKAEMIAQADKALYQSKREGRNRVTHAKDFYDDIRLAS